jgi:hypothetical protein
VGTTRDEASRQLGAFAGEEPCHGRLRGDGAGFGAGTGSGCTGVADDGTAALAIALICAAILASIVLSWAATCWEIPSSFLLASSNLTPEVTLLPSTFMLSWSTRALSRLTCAPRVAMPAIRTTITAMMSQRSVMAQAPRLSRRQMSPSTRGKYRSFDGLALHRTLLAGHSLAAQMIYAAPCQ